MTRWRSSNHHLLVADTSYRPYFCLENMFDLTGSYNIVKFHRILTENRHPITDNIIINEIILIDKCLFHKTPSGHHRWRWCRYTGWSINYYNISVLNLWILNIFIWKRIIPLSVPDYVHSSECKLLYVSNSELLL